MGGVIRCRVGESWSSRKILARKARFVKFSTALANKKAIAVKVRSILAFLKAWPWPWDDGKRIHGHDDSKFYFAVGAARADFYSRRCRCYHEDASGPRSPWYKSVIYMYLGSVSILLAEAVVNSYLSLVHFTHITCIYMLHFSHSCIH